MTEELNPASPAAKETPKEPVRSNGTRPTPASHMADMSPQERWLADKAAADAADPWLDTSKVLARNKAGDLVQHEKVIGADGEVRAGRRLNDDGQPAADDGTKPPGEAAGETTIKVGDAEFTEREVRDAMSAKAEADLRKTQIPQSPEAYKVELPADLKIPGDAKFELAGFDSPIHGAALRDAAAWAHRNGLSQGQFSEMLGLYAGSMVQEATAIANAAQQERAAMGVTGGTRVDSISRWLTANFGAAAKPMITTLATKAQVEIWESVIGKLINQGGSSFSGRRDAEPQTVDEATYQTWNYTQRKEYAEQATARAAQNGSRRR